MKRKTTTALIAFFALAVCSCQKASDLESLAQAQNFYNRTDQPIDVSVYTSFSYYINNNYPKKFTIPPNSKLKPMLQPNLYYIDWQTSDTSLSNWGVVIDTSIADLEVNNLIALPNRQENIKTYNITTENATVRSIYLGNTNRAVWLCVAGLDKNGKPVEETKNLLLSTITIRKNYSVVLDMPNRKQPISLFTKQFLPAATSFTDSTGAGYTATVLSGPSRALDTLSLKLPFTDTTYKFVKKN